MNPSINLDPAWLVANLDEAARTLGVELRRGEASMVQELPDVTIVVATEVILPFETPIEARFVREGLFERVKKLFRNELTVGSAAFDDQIYVITSTREQTAQLLAPTRVQKAVLALVDATSHVEIAGSRVRLLDQDVASDYKRSAAELLAIAAHLSADAS